MPTLALPKVWVKVAVSPEARLPDVMVGTPAEAVVASYTLVSLAAVTVIARPVITPVSTDTNVTA